MKTPDQSANRSINQEPGSGGTKNIEQQLEGLDLSPEIKKLLIEGRAKKYTIEVGGKTGHRYERELSEKNIMISDWAIQILDKMPATEKHEFVDFISVSPQNLGIQALNREQQYARAKELGLDLCQPEDGPAFYLSNDDNRIILIAMEPIPNAKGELCTFRVDFDNEEGKKALNAPFAGKGSVGPEDHQVLFRLRKNVKDGE